MHLETINENGKYEDEHVCSRKWQANLLTASNTSTHHPRQCQCTSERDVHGHNATRTNVTLECVNGPSAGSLAGTLLRLLLPLSEKGERHEKHIHLTPRWFLFFPGSNDEGDIQSTSAPYSKSCLVLLAREVLGGSTLGRGRRERRRKRKRKGGQGEKENSKKKGKKEKRIRPHSAHAPLSYTDKATEQGKLLTSTLYAKSPVYRDFPTI